MSHTITRWVWVVSAVAAVALGPSLMAQTSASDAALKARAVAPKATDIDKTATVDALLAKSKPADWSATKGAALEGYVIQVIRSEDSDIRLYLAAKPEETDTRKWVIIEVKPAWMEKLPGLAQAKLWELHGKKVRVTGWLFFDATPVKYPRGTNWEIHPATEIVPVK
jgi:hypothetical protein